MSILKRSTPVEKAFADHSNALDTVARWQAEQGTKSAELADLEARIGSEVLDDETAAERLAEQAAKLRAQIDVAARTAAAAQARVIEAGRAVLRAYSAEQQEQADRLRAQAEQRQTKTDKLLAELSEWEGGCKYVPWEPNREAVQFGASVSYKIPLTEALRRQAKGLADKAAEYEQHAGGTSEHVAAQVARLAARKSTPEPAKVTA
jgi:predicted ribosome quality control (RQC) complex YloA/Tae2 family protein